MLEKIIDFITGESAVQREHDRWVADFYRRFPPPLKPGEKPRLITREEVEARTRRVIIDARRRGVLPPRSESRWAEYLDC